MNTSAKIALIISGIVILGAVVFFLVQRQSTVAAKASTGAGGDVDPLTGQRWQTVAEAEHQANASASTQHTTAVLA